MLDKRTRSLVFLLLIASSIILLRNHIDLLDGKSETSKAKSQITIMTWNTQGGSYRNGRLSVRAGLILHTILQEEPDIVFFQEIWDFKAICTTLRMTYSCSPELWALGILYKKAKFNAEGFEEIFLNQTRISIGNNNVLLISKMHLSDNPETRLALMNTHLLPYASAVIPRTNQLKMCFKIGKKFPENYNVIFGGDMNLEEEEENEVQPESFKDLWKECGYSERIRYTWDGTDNEIAKTLLSSSHQVDQKPRTRYDRIYFRPSKPRKLELASLKLTGKAKIEESDIPASDHWAMFATFKLSNNQFGPPICKVTS